MAALVIIPAAGSGARFGGEIPKQFRALAGTPILLRVIERFFNDERVGHVVVAVAEPLLANVKQTERVRFVAGGATRQESVIRALEAAEAELDLVAVHDAVRPFFKTATFHALLDAAAEHGAAFPAMPVTDTIRIGHGIDVHAFDEDRRLILGGVRISERGGLAGHSDADAVLHAIVDAILGATGSGDIGQYFPSDDERWKNADSAIFIGEARRIL